MSKNLGSPLLLRFIRIDPRLSWQLILISLYLCLIGLANTSALFGIIRSGETTDILTTVASTVMHLVPAYGLFTMRRWGRLLEIGISAIALAIAVALAFGGEFFWCGVIVAIHGSILKYLLSKPCKELFAQVNPVQL